MERLAIAHRDAHKAILIRIDRVNLHVRNEKMKLLTLHSMPERRVVVPGYFSFKISWWTRERELSEKFDKSTMR